MSETIRVRIRRDMDCAAGRCFSAGDVVALDVLGGYAVPKCGGSKFVRLLAVDFEVIDERCDECEESTQ